MRNQKKAYTSPLKIEIDSKPATPHFITRDQAMELVELFESVGYDQDTPFAIYTNEQVMPVKVSANKNG